MSKRSSFQTGTSTFRKQSARIDPEQSRHIRHALRTPINHILGYCEMLLEEGEVPNGFRPDLERIQAGGRQLLNLITEHFDQPIKTKSPRDIHLLYHDLRTPVNQVVGYCELLQEEAAQLGKPQLIPELQKIHDAAILWLGLMEKNLRLPPTEVPAETASESRQSKPQSKTREIDGAQVAKQTETESTWQASGSQTSYVIKEEPAELLIVDDNQIDRELLARRFQRRSYQVTIATNGADAIRLIQSHSYDLVLLDLVMPGMGGMEVLKRVRKHRSMTDLPIIVVTGMDSSSDVVEALRLGANDFLTKPASFAVVQARSQTHLRLKRAQEQLQARMDEVRQLAGALEKRNAFIQQVFGRYVTDAIVQTLLDTPEGLKLGGEKREVTILMSDLRGFTALAESLPPERVIELLNLYLGEMTRIISQHDGVIDEFIGDAILTIFGAPIQKENHAERAIACALSMQLAMPRVNEQLAALGIPPLAMGIGINTGQVVVGNIGSAKRAKYGVVGSPVNITSRIQSSALAGEVLVSETTAKQVGSVLGWKQKRQLQAKGISEPLTLYIAHSLGRPHNLFLEAATRQREVTRD